MEEVDNIIMHSLRQLGVSISTDIESLVEFPSDLVVTAVSKCLQTIRPGSDIPKTHTSGMSQKYQNASRLATLCKDLGYKGDMGYQTFLYPDENDLRRVFMFLIERLPKEYDKNEEDQPTDNMSILLMNIRKKVEYDLNDAWVPRYCRNKSLILDNTGSWVQNGCRYVSPDIQTTVKTTRGSVNVLEDFLKSMATFQRNDGSREYSNQRTVNKLNESKVKSIIEKFTTLKVEQTDNVENIVSIQNAEVIESQTEAQTVVDSYSHETPTIKSVSPVEETLENPKNRKRGEETKMATLQLKQAVYGLKEDTSLLENEIQQLKQNMSKLSTLKTQRQAHLEEIMNNVNLYKNFVDDLPNTEDDLLSINRSIEEIDERMSNLVKEWDEHRIPLEIEIQTVEQSRSENQSLTSKKLNEIETITIKLEGIKQELANKQNLHSEMLSEYTNLSKNVKSRSGYTRKIMEIIGNITKQKTEIEKILSDTRTMQKEMNNLSGQLDRSFTLADELIFKDVKKDEHSKKVYKLLATLHTVCGEITTMVNDTGTCLRDIRDLEEHVEAEKGKNVKETLAKINSDLKQTQIEMQMLTKKIKERFEEYNKENTN